MPVLLYVAEMFLFCLSCYPLCDRHVLSFHALLYVSDMSSFCFFCSPICAPPLLFCAGDLVSDSLRELSDPNGRLNEWRQAERSARGSAGREEKDALSSSLPPRREHSHV